MPKTTAVARYVTKGGEMTGTKDCTVEITDDGNRAVAECRGCGASHDHGSAYTFRVREWAQSHAEACRAI